MTDIAIIGAMDVEISYLTSLLEERKTVDFCGLKFNTGMLFGKKITIVKCGIGKVFAAMAASAVIAGFSPRLSLIPALEAHFQRDFALLTW